MILWIGDRNHITSFSHFFMKKNHWLFLFLLFFWIGNLLAQEHNYAPKKVAGELFLKIKNEKQLTLGSWNQQADARHLQTGELHDLYQLVQQFGIHQLQPAFKTQGEDLDNIYLLKFDPTQSVTHLMQALEALHYVEYVEQVPYCYPLYQPNDYDSANMYHLPIIDAPEAWDVTKGSAEVKIAIVDNAVLISHPDLAPNVWINPGETPNNGVDDDGNGFVDDISGWDSADDDNDPNTPANAPGFASFNHGTGVAGCASAATDNNIGVAGIGFNCKLIGIKIKSSFNITDDLFSGADALEGMDYAIAAGADVVNTSFVFAGVSQVFQALINRGYEQGIVFVAGAGNSSSNFAFSPATLEHVISVAATTSSDRKAGFSTYHATVDISAPGARIRTTTHSTNLSPFYTITDGTSFSSPIVAGVVGLMKSVNPCLSPADIDSMLKATADNINVLNPAFVGLIGAGRVNANAAVRAAQLTGAPDTFFDMDTTDLCAGILRCQYTPTLPNCADSIAWEVNGQTSQSFAPVFQLDSAGTYQIRLFVKNARGSNQTIQTLSIDEPLLIETGTNAEDQLFACFGQSKQIPATSNKSNASFRWSPGFGLSNPNIINPEVFPTGSATYTLTATDTSGCTVVKEVHIVLAVAPTVNAGQDEFIAYGDSVQLQATGNGTGLQYFWSPGLGLSDSTIANPIAFPATTTTYTLTLADVNDCVDSDQLTVQVSGVGIAGDGRKSISLLDPAPNPANESMLLQVKLEKSAKIQLDVYDMRGKKLTCLYEAEERPGDFRFVWKKGSLEAGIYMLLWEINGQQVAQKVIWY